MDKPTMMAEAMAARPAPPPISKPDSAFVAVGVEFVWGNEVDMAELNDLFAKVRER